MAPFISHKVANSGYITIASAGQYPGYGIKNSFIIVSQKLRSRIRSRKPGTGASKMRCRPAVQMISGPEERRL